MNDKINFSVAAILFTCCEAQALDIHVPLDQPTIQDGIVAAAPAGDTVIVAAGLYDERIDFLGKSVIVISEEGPTVTVIDGGGLGSVVTASNAEPPATRLTGFTIDNGDAPNGGGLYISEASPTFTDCIIRNCVATNGGGAYINLGQPIFLQCWFDNNLAAYGGGLYNLGNATMTDCDLTGNTAWYAGGAIYQDGGQLNATTCLIDDNMALPNNIDQGSGGAIYAILATLQMDDVQIKNNRGWAAGGIWSYRCDVLVTNSLFDRNEAEIEGGSTLGYYGTHQYEACGIQDGSAKNGAGLMHLYSLVSVRDCDILSNAAADTGGGFYGVQLEPNSNVNATSFASNTATTGAGMALDQASNFLLDHSVFFGNHALEHGGGIQADECVITSMLCASLGNTAGQHGAALDVVDSTATFEGWSAGQNVAGGDGGVVHGLRSDLYFFAADFQDNKGTEGGGVACRDCTVFMSGSFVRINTATATGGGFHIDPLGMLQLAGTLVCGNVPNQIIGPWNDLGFNVIDAVCSGCEGDVDGDLFVGVNDLLAVIDAWGACPGCQEDVNADGFVDVTDLLVVLDQWGWCS